MRRCSAFVVLTAAILACGKSETDPSPAAGQNAVGSAAESAEAAPAPEATIPAEIPKKSSDPTPQTMNTTALGVALVLPRLVSVGLMSSRSMMVEGVYFATAQTGAAQLGQVTSTGTVTLSQLGALYEPTPSDRLIAKIGNQTHEFRLLAAEGNNMAATAASWLLAPHRLEYTHRIPDRADIKISEQFDGTQFEVALKGWSVLGGKKYDLDLTATGGTQGDRDTNGQETRTQYQLTGTVRGEGFEVDVRETNAIHFASATSLYLLHSQRGSATQVRSVIDSAVRMGKSTIQFNSLQVETGHKEKGFNESAGIVSASGTVSRDGAAFGQLTLQNDAPVIATPSGVIPVTLDTSGW